MIEDLEMKKLEIKLEELKFKREGFRHKYIMEELSLKKSIALLYKSKKHLNRLNKIEKRERELLIEKSKEDLK